MNIKYSLFNSITKCFFVNILDLVIFGFHSIAATQYLFTRFFFLLLIQSLIYCYISFDISHIEFDINVKR